MSLDCDSSSDGPLLTLEETLQRIRASVVPLNGCERVSLEDARGRVLAQELLSPMDCPPFANAAMDGFALRSQDTTGRERAILDIVGTAWAGHPYEGSVGADQCVRIFTGAVVPADTDAVIMQEAVQATAEQIAVTGRVECGHWVRAAGRDMAAGHRALPAGKRLTAIDLGLIASFGLPELTVNRRVRVGLLSTGDELTPLGSPLPAGAIYDSNRLAIKALLSPLALQVTNLGVCRDDRSALKSTLLDAAAWNDVIVTIGGASVGDADHVVPVLEALGRLELWKIAVKPGKPFLYGQIGRCQVFGLPGNPASALVTCLQLVRPALLQLMGAIPELPLRVQARCEQTLTKTTGRIEFQRGIYRSGQSEGLTVSAVTGQDADRLASFAAANCFIVLPADSRGAAAGERVMIEPFSSYG